MDPVPSSEGELAALVGVHHTVRQIVVESKRKLTPTDVKLLQRLGQDEVYIACGMRSEGKAAAHIVGYLLDRNQRLVPPPTVGAVASRSASVNHPQPANKFVPSHALFSAAPLSRQHTAMTATSAGGRSSSAAARFGRSNTYHEKAVNEQRSARHERDNRIAAKRDELDARLNYAPPRTSGRRRSTTPAYKSAMLMQPVPVVERTGHMTHETQREFRGRSRSPSVSIPYASNGTRRSRTPPASVYQPYSRQPSPATSHSAAPRGSSVGAGRVSSTRPSVASTARPSGTVKGLSPDSIAAASAVDAVQKFERTPSPIGAAFGVRNPAESVSRARATRWMNAFIERLHAGRITEAQWNHMASEVQDEYFLKWRIPYIQRRVVALWYSQGTF